MIAHRFAAPWAAMMYLHSIFFVRHNMLLFDGCQSRACQVFSKFIKYDFALSRVLTNEWTNLPTFRPSSLQLLKFLQSVCTANSQNNFVLTCSVKISKNIGENVLKGCKFWRKFVNTLYKGLDDSRLSSTVTTFV